MRLGIVGSRTRNSQEDYQIVEDIVLDFHKKHVRKLILVSGGCSKGADNFAEQIKDKFGIPILIFPPDKIKLKTLNTGNYKKDYAIIAYERNSEIAKASAVLLALVADNRVGGTEDTIRKFLKCNLHDNLMIK